jgi:hypothetical protein
MRLIWCHEGRPFGFARDKLVGAASWRAGGGVEDGGEGEESFRIPDCRDEESLWGAVWGEAEVGLERDSSPPQECVGDSE